VQTFERLKSQFENFWIDLLKKWIYQTPSVEVIAKPSEHLMKENGKADKQRVADRKTKLGKKGLKELAKRVENAIEENDVGFIFIFYLI
jgi:Zn-dependent M16 (insulinase) family peptidase